MKVDINKAKRIITFGTFDVFHVGHLRILKRARALGQYLIVGISTDSLNFKKKGRLPVYSEEERLEIVSSVSCVSETFFEHSLELKSEYIKKFNADILVMGDDWLGKFDHLDTLCEITYLPRTPVVSTTALIEKIKME